MSKLLEHYDETTYTGEEVTGTGPFLSLQEVVNLLTAHWQKRLEKGRLTHLAVNNIALADGTVVNVRLLVQRTR